MDFWRAYLRAAVAAWAILVIAFVTASGFGWGPLFDGLVLAVFAIPHVFIVTLAAGAAGLWVLKLLAWKRLPCYVGTGLVLGALPAYALLGATDPPTIAGGMALFAVMGAAAAGTYWLARRPA